MSKTIAAQSCSFGKRIDFHTHILPGMDDGSASVEMSMEMLGASVQQGVRAVVLTPHFYATSDDPRHFLEKRNARMALLKSRYPQKVPLLLAGAEIHYFDGLVSMQQLPLMRIENTRGLMIEMPMNKWSQRMIYDIMELNRQRDYQVILAHIERYLPFDNRQALRQLASDGVMMQVSSGAFSGLFRSANMLKLLDEGLLHILGSDCHNMTSRPPNLSDAYTLIERKRGTGAVKQIMENGLRLFSMK